MKTINNRTPFKRLIYLLVLLLLAGCGGTKPQLGNGIANCKDVETLGNLLKPILLPIINNELAGEEFEVSKRKTVLIKGISKIEFDGCIMKIRLELILKRKIRKDAEGYVDFKIKITEATNHRLCLDGLKITKINLSHLTRLGERIIQAFLNKKLPDGKCFEF